MAGRSSLESAVTHRCDRAVRVMSGRHALEVVAASSQASGCSLPHWSKPVERPQEAKSSGLSGVRDHCAAAPR